MGKAIGVRTPGFLGYPGRKVRARGWAWELGCLGPLLFWEENGGWRLLEARTAGFSSALGGVWELVGVSRWGLGTQLPGFNSPGCPPASRAGLRTANLKPGPLGCHPAGHQEALKNLSKRPYPVVLVAPIPAPGTPRDPSPVTPLPSAPGPPGAVSHRGCLPPPNRSVAAPCTSPAVQAEPLAGSLPAPVG